MQHWKDAGSTTHAKESDIDYFRKRAIQEQVAAQSSSCPTARRLHEEMAEIYRFRVAMLSDQWADAGVVIALQRLTRNGSTSSMRTLA